jgi:type IV pilus assembly protein PilE
MKKKKSTTGFTLLEIIVVIVILGILAALGFIQYGRTIERSRTAEARAILGGLRTAEVAYYLSNRAYADLNQLSIEAPTACIPSHYFSYSVTALSGLATATRCIAGDNGKDPAGPSPYIMTVDFTSGIWGGDAGYY